MILHLYFARRYATTFLFIAGIFFGIIVLIDLVDEVRRFEGESVSFASLIGLTLLSVPETLYAILPLLTIISTLTLFVSLSRTSELVVARASGRSAFRSLIGPIATTLVIGVLAVAVLNPIVAATTRQYDVLADNLTGAPGAALSVGREGIWLRQANGDDQTVIRADRVTPDGTELLGVAFHVFDAPGRPIARIEAGRATLTPGAWRLTNAKTWHFDRPNPEREAVTEKSATFPTDLTASRILDGFGDPAEVPIWALPAAIAALQEAGFSARRHVVFFQMQLALPVLLVAMLLIGATFTMRHSRVSRTGLMVLLAMTMGFGLFFIRNFAQILGQEGQIPALLSAWGPPVAAVLLPLGLLLHWEDG